MPRLIDADAYKHVLEGWLADMHSTEESEDREAILSCICQLDTMQAVDASPVVRCKDCKHKGWVQEPCHGKSIDYCRIWDCALQNPKKIFCSYGERKGGDEYLHSIQRSKECD